jgi:predicted DNA-binding transcriptional regulator AlpA
LRTWDAYDEFAQTYNQHLPRGALALARGSTVSRALPLSLENALKVAEGELTTNAAIEKDLEERLPTITPETLVGVPLVVRYLKLAPGHVIELSDKDEKFPTPVVHLSRHAAWLHSDIKLYRKGLKVPKRTIDELQHTVMGLPELVAELGMTEITTRRYISEERWGLVPKPEGALAYGAKYWLRAKVEAWQKEKAKADKTKAKEEARESAAARQQAEAKQRAKREAKQRAKDREKAARAKAAKQREKRARE